MAQRLEVAAGERAQDLGRFVHAGLDLAAYLRALPGERDGANATIAGVRAAFGEPVLLEPVDEPGDVRRVALPGAGERAHRLRHVGVELEQRVHGARVQPERRRHRRELLLAHHHHGGEQAPGLVGGVVDRDRLGGHPRMVRLFTRCFKYIEG